MIETWPQAVFAIIVWLSLANTIVEVTKIVFEKPPIDEFENQ